MAGGEDPLVSLDGILISLPADKYRRAHLGVHRPFYRKNRNPLRSAMLLHHDARPQHLRDSFSRQIAVVVEESRP